MEPDFGGYATKAGLRCTDGRVIQAKAFQHMDGQTVPLVWQHGHKETTNVLGYATLEARADGVYARGFFNETPNGQHAKMMVQHGDVKALSIWANQLQELNKSVSHGAIREVSLVLSGANPGAKIDQVKIQHSSDPDDFDELTDEAIISHMGPVEFAVENEEADAEEEVEPETEVAHAAAADATVQDVVDTMSPEQQNVMYYMIGAALDEAAGSGDNAAEHSDTETDEETLVHQEGTDDMTGRNVFDQADAGTSTTEKFTLSHADVQAIFTKGRKMGSLKEAVLQYVDDHNDEIKHGITSIETLFPDAQNLTNTPEFNARRQEWVQGVLNGTRHTPFSRIKTITADITQDEARAKGYIKGNYKIEEWFGVTKRTTTPTTIYKKQKLDRDDILDITDFDVVAWMRAEMRLMLDEELARAILIGDGRDPSSDDKIKDPLGASDGAGIRSIYNDHELFVTRVYVNVDDALSSYDEVVDVVMDGFEYYKGTGSPTFYTTVRQLNMFLKAKDGQGRRLYNNVAEVAQILGVGKIVTVEPMNDVADLVGIIVNLDDYNVGADKGGEVTMFDDFDIDYNQQKYLLETRVSGALTKIKSAIVILKTAVGNVLVAPSKPAFVTATGVITIPTVTGVVYKAADGTTTLSAGAQTALTAGSSTVVKSVPASGYYFANNRQDEWSFTRPSA
jgi:HK97 family phage prohead protease